MHVPPKSNSLGGPTAPYLHPPWNLTPTRPHAPRTQTVSERDAEQKRKRAHPPPPPPLQPPTAACTHHPPPPPPTRPTRASNPNPLHPSPSPVFPFRALLRSPFRINSPSRLRIADLILADLHRPPSSLSPSPPFTRSARLRPRPLLHWPLQLSLLVPPPVVASPAISRHPRIPEATPPRCCASQNSFWPDLSALRPSIPLREALASSIALSSSKWLPPPRYAAPARQFPLVTPSRPTGEACCGASSSSPSHHPPSAHVALRTHRDHRIPRPT